MHVQLWSYNYDPEPSGIGPVSTTLARALRARGHVLDVIAAHPHYPAPVWGTRRLPYREVREGIPVLRLPLWVGRANSRERYRQELSFLAAQLAALPVLGRPDASIVVSPSFPALLSAILSHRARRVPWVLWLHDLLPDGATATGLVDEDSIVLRAARRLELAAYRHAERIVVLSTAFQRNLTAKGVPSEKVELIYDPATRTPSERVATPLEPKRGPLRLLSMGNIGHSQGLAPLVAAFEADDRIDGRARLVITGTGVAVDDVFAQAKSERTRLLGMVSDEQLEIELQRADIALVTQHHEGAEFNIPSKLMNFMIYGLPIVAAVNPDSEVARLVEESGGGWVVDSGNPQSFPALVTTLLERAAEVSERGRAARHYASEHFTVEGFAERFDRLLFDLGNSQGAARRLGGRR